MRPKKNLLKNLLLKSHQTKKAIFYNKACICNENSKFLKQSPQDQYSFFAIKQSNWILKIKYMLKAFNEIIRGLNNKMSQLDIPVHMKILSNANVGISIVEDMLRLLITGKDLDQFFMYLDVQEMKIQSSYVHQQ